MPTKPSLLERAIENVAARLDRRDTEDVRSMTPQETLRMLAQEIADERANREAEIARILS